MSNRDPLNLRAVLDNMPKLHHGAVRRVWDMAYREGMEAQKRRNMEAAKLLGWDADGECDGGKQ